MKSDGRLGRIRQPANHPDKKVTSMNISAVNPYLSVADTKKAIDFYTQAFGAVEIGPRLTAPDGGIVHTELKIGESTIMLSDENPDFENHSPLSLGGTPVRMNLEVDDADAAAEQAVAAGAELAIPVSDQFYGYRSGRLVDPFGHQWILSQKVDDLSHEEMQTRMNAFFS